jgi:nitrate reductase alpha subunit
LQALASTQRGPREPGKELVLNYLTPHSKWSIHSTYSDTLPMLTLFRGGEAIWLNDEDARQDRHSRTTTGWSASISTAW